MRMVLAMLLILLATPMFAADFDDELEAWRQKRVDGLIREESWTSLVGLDWLDADTSTRIGSGDENDVVIAGLPERFGTIRRESGRWLLALAPGAAATVAGRDIDSETPIFDERARDPSTQAAKVVAGRIRFVLIERAGRIGMRAWDTQAPLRLSFPGIDSFTGDTDWRIDARWQPHDPPRTIDIATVIGTVEPMANPGAAVFERDGKNYTLQALQDEGSDELFFIFADRTSGKTTYGAGRYLYAPIASNGIVRLDFNRAFNPPCAFSGFATCPLPPPENRLDLEVTAGEKKFAGLPH